MIFKSNKEYERLSRKAVLWDSLPFEHINFTGRVIDKYGRNYFNERYSYISGDFYNNIKRTNLDTVDKIIGLSIANNTEQEEQVKNEFIKVMSVPEEYKEIWKNTIPLRYYQDYKDRKYLLDSYLKTLPPEKQAIAIKTMCLNNESKNYLAFLDLEEDEMTFEQKNLFDELVHFFETMSINENIEKQQLAEKAVESKKYSLANKKVNEKINEFLYENDLKNDDVSYLKMIENNERDLEFFKTKNQYDDNYRFTVSSPGIDNSLLRDKFQSINNQQATNNSNFIDDQANNQSNNNVNTNYRPIYANSYTQSFIDNKNVRDQFSGQNKTINQFDKLLNKNNNFTNSIDNNSYVENLNFSNFTNKQKPIFNKSFQQSNVNYKEYIKSPSVYNIVDLINNREIEATNNREVVDQIVRSTVQVNNQYSKQGVAYNSPIVNGKLSANSSPNFARNNPLLVNNSNQHESSNRISLSELKNGSSKNNMSPFDQRPNNVANEDSIIPRNNDLFNLSKPVRSQELISLKSIRPKSAVQAQEKQNLNDVNVKYNTINSNNMNNRNASIDKIDISSLNLAPNKLNTRNYVNKFTNIVNSNEVVNNIQNTNANFDSSNSSNNSYEFIKPFKPKISLNLDNDMFNFEPSIETKNTIKNSSNTKKETASKKATNEKDINIPVVKRKTSTSKATKVKAAVRK